MNFTEVTESQTTEGAFTEDLPLVPTLTLWPTKNSSPFSTRTLTFENGPVIFGRTDGLFKIGDDMHPTTTNAIFVEGTVSRHHAQVTFEEGQFLLKDLKSSHGTRLNGDKLGSGPGKGPYILKHGDIISMGAHGWANGLEFKPIEGLIHLAYPFYQSVVPSSLDQYPATSQSQEQHAKKVGEGIDTDIMQNTQDTERMQDTPSLDGLILHYQSDNSPNTKRKVNGLLQAQAYKQKYSLSDTEAVRLVPELMQFPEDD